MGEQNSCPHARAFGGLGLSFRASSLYKVNSERHSWPPRYVLISAGSTAAEELHVQSLGLTVANHIVPMLGFAV